MKVIASALFASALAFGACADDHDHEHEHGDPVEEAVEHGCLHLDNGPDQAVTAGTDAAGAADVTFEHSRVKIALNDDGGGQYSGFVSFSADEETDIVFIWNKVVPVAITDGSGAAVTPEESMMSPEACTSAAVADVVEVGVGTYTLALGPTTESEVWLVFEEAGHEHAH